MPSSSICWGVEVGAGAIKALKLELAGEGNARVLDFVMLPHKKVLSTPDLDQADALRVALGALASQVDLTGASIAVSVPGHSAFARFAKLPPVEPKKVPDIVKFEAVQQIPFPIDQVEWDYQTFVSPDSPDIEVGIFAITRDRIMERLTLYEDVGIVPDYVTLSPVAAYNAMAYDLQFTEKTPGTIILDIGTTSTDLIVAEAGRVWIRTFPIGGHHFTEALVNAFQLSYPKAEKLKREADSSKHARHIFQAMRPVFGDLAQDVQRSIGYYTSLHKEAKLERLIGLGSTFRLPGLRKYLKQQLQLDVYRMEQFKRVTLDGPKAGEFQAMTLNMGTAYGLALQGLGLAALEANLMPTGVIRDAMWKRKVKWFGIAAGIAIAAGAAMFIRPFLDSQAVANEPPSATIAQVVRDAGKLKADAAPLTNPSLSDTIASDVMGLLEGREYFAYIVSDVGTMLQDASDKAKAIPSFKEGPAFRVTSLDTEFVPAPSGEGAAAPDPAAPLAAQPRIQVHMSVESTVADAQTFAISTLDEWLRANAKRAGIPYEIVTGKNPSIKIGSRMADAAPTTGAPGAETPAATGGGRVPVSGGGGGKGGGGRGGFEILGGGPEAKPVVIRQPGGGGRGGRGGGGSEQGQASQPDQRAQAAQEQLKKLASLPGAPPEEPGTMTTQIEVTWEAVILPKEAAPTGGSQ